jgi:HD-like signal output (HDOD) protein
MPPSAAPAPVSDAGSPIESREEAYVRRILAADDFPSFSRVMSDVMASLRGDDASAQRLANLVLRDYALTVKVIRTANTIHYNRSGRRVQSATHALMLLGARTVRDLALGLLLFEQYRRRSPGMKELMLLSLLTASHARDAAVRRGADPEAAQLCGMFRNLGEVLVAAHLPVEYTDILRRTKVQRAGAGQGERISRAQAALAVLGCSFEDVGCAIAQHWGMPDSVRRGMRAVGAKGEDVMETATAFGHALTTAIYRDEDMSSRDAVDRVLKQFGTPLGLTRDALAAVADAAVAETRETFASARVGLDDLRLTRQIAVALSEAARPLTPDEVEAEVRAGTRLADTPTTPHQAVDTLTDVAPVSGPALAALRERMTHDLALAVEDVGTYEMQRAILVALEAALRGGPFDRVCFCAVDVGRHELRARFGLGVGVEALVAHLALALPPNAGSPGPAIMRGEEVVLSLGTRLSIHEAHALRTWGAASAALFPVVIEGAAIGAIYVDRRTTATGLDAPTLAYLRRVVAYAAQSLAVRRAASAEAAPTSAPATAPATASPAAPVAALVDARPTGPVTRPAAVAPASVAVPAPAPRRVPEGAERLALVLRALKGEVVGEVVAGTGVTAAELVTWRDEFLLAAVAAMQS